MVASTSKTKHQELVTQSVIGLVVSMRRGRGATQMADVGYQLTTLAN